MNETDKKLKVFISYASEDRATATQLRDLISADGHEPWYDQDILPGKQWEREIERNLDDADVVVIVLSNSSVKKKRTCPARSSSGSRKTGRPTRHRYLYPASSNRQLRTP